MLAKLKAFFTDPMHIVNLLTAVSGALAFFQGSDLIAANPKATAATATAVAVVNVLMRLFTPATPAAAKAAS